MYLIRRIARTQPGKAWEVASCLTKICEAYEDGGRNKAQIYVGQGLPGDSDVAYAEWTQERIEPIVYSNVPKSVDINHDKMMEMVTAYDIEFYEVVTPEKLKDHGVE